MAGPNDWCLRWEETHHKAKPWDRIRHAIAEFIRADEFYEGSGYECEGDVVDIFRSEWTERICVERNPGYKDSLGGIYFVADWIPSLRSTEAPLLKMLSRHDEPSDSVIRWDWGKLEPIDSDSSENPTDRSAAPPPD